MKPARVVMRLASVVLVCLALLACGGGEAAHSDYFVVSFLPGTPAPSEQGVEALASAARQAGRNPPFFIEIVAAQPTNGDPPKLAQQRIDTVKQALAREGIDERLVRVTFRVYPGKDYDERKDSFLLDIGYRTPP